MNFKPMRILKRFIHATLPHFPPILQRIVSMCAYYWQKTRYTLRAVEKKLPVQRPIDRNINSIIIVTSFFDPYQNPILMQNYQKFWHTLKRQNIELCTIELVFKKQQYQLTKNDASQLIQAHSNSIMWQKEALYNKAARELVDKYDAIVFLDSDVYFKNDNWVNVLNSQLQLYAVVQPFSTLIRLANSVDYVEESDVRFGFLDGQKIPSCASSVLRLGTGSLPFPFVRGSVGIGLAVRSEILKQCPLYDGLIVGGGDHLNLFAGYNALPHFVQLLSKQQNQHILEWKQAWFDLVKNSIGAVDQTVYHYYHGSQLGKNKQNRQYILANHNFNPLQDIVLNTDGVFEWNTANQDLIKAVDNYFFMREKNVYAF